MSTIETAPTFTEEFKQIIREYRKFGALKRPLTREEGSRVGALIEKVVDARAEFQGTKEQWLALWCEVTGESVQPIGDRVQGFTYGPVEGDSNE